MDVFIHLGGGAFTFILLFTISLAMSEPQQKCSLKKKNAGFWWLTPIILAIWEAEIRRITV
jgi:hypothetical protein